MTDVNQEADMGYVRDFVAKVAEALVAATELPKQIEAMRNDLATLSSDLDKTKSRNIELDTALNDTRRQRDEAEQALSQVKNELASTKYNLDEANRSLVNSQGGMEKLVAELDQVKKDRDDYGMKQMEAEERASQAEAKLAKLAEALGLPKPVDKPAEVKAAPIPWTNPPADNAPQSAPQDVQSAEPTQAQPEPKRIYEGEPGFEYNTYPRGRSWDDKTHRYYIVDDDMPF